jgi:hypothetical protein
MQALIGMGANNCKLMVVKWLHAAPADDPIHQGGSEARGAEEITVPARERPQS